LFAASVNAQGDRWVGVGRDKDAVYYVDKQTLERTGSTVKVWTLQNYSTRQQIPVTKLGYRSVKEFFKFDCEKRTLEVLSRSKYSETSGKGDVIASRTWPEGLNTEPVVPDTTGEGLLRFVCEPSGALTK
jgi:hypothetical protein